MLDEVFVGEVAPNGHFEVEFVAGTGRGTDRSERIEESGDDFVEINRGLWPHRAVSVGPDEVDLSVGRTNNAPMKIMHRSMMLAT